MQTTRELHQVRKKMWDASMENHSRYLDKDSMRFADRFVEERSCPACAESKSSALFLKSGGQYVSCDSCMMVFLNPVFKDEALEDYYRNNHAVQSAIVASDNEFYRNLYLAGLRQVSHWVTNGGQTQKNLLDVGCSAGGFLNIAKEQGWSTYGLELNSTEIEIARRGGHKVQQAVLAQAKFDIPLQAITLWDVFEHIKDGRSFLEEAKRVLCKDGLVFIQSPSSDSLAARMMQEKCNMFDGLEHVNLFGEKQLRLLAERSGYELVGYTSVISEIGVMNNYLNYEDPYLGKTSNTKTLVDLIDGETILEKKLGYKFQACLKLRQ